MFAVVGSAPRSVGKRRGQQRGRSQRESASVASNRATGPICCRVTFSTRSAMMYPRVHSATLGNGNNWGTASKRRDDRWPKAYCSFRPSIRIAADPRYSCRGSLSAYGMPERTIGTCGGRATGLRGGLAAGRGGGAEILSRMLCSTASSLLLKSRVIPSWLAASWSTLRLICS